jgi:hypothetical protein
MVCAVCAAATYAGLWACYDFRYDAGPDGMRSDVQVGINRLRLVQLRQRLGHEPTQAELAAWKAPLLTRAVLFADGHRLLPQAWVAGFISTEIEDQGQRAGDLFGELYPHGKWYYFPLAGVFKSPLSTLAAGVIALVIGLVKLGGMFFPAPGIPGEGQGGGYATAAGKAGVPNRQHFAKPPPRSSPGIPGAEEEGERRSRERMDVREFRRAAIALFIPAAVYALASITAEINIGLRHAFPIYPFVFIAIGLAMGRLWGRRAGKFVVATLGVLLVVETATAFPNFIAFFNVACRADRLYLLSDSNFDWGQDLPLLAQWQKKHPDVTLYFDCFGRCDPAAYGIRYVNLPDGYTFGPAPTLPDKPGVVALSATNIQLNFNSDPAKWSQIGLTPDSRPDKILGTTIYLYSIHPAPK